MNCKDEKDQRTKRKTDVTVAGEQDDNRYPWVIHPVLLDQEGRPKYLNKKTFGVIRIFSVCIPNLYCRKKVGMRTIWHHQWTAKLKTSFKTISNL